ncbi:hypothetical protein GCM10010116_44310 [Microbispora rosea subsp. aerata]|nr:PHB depolymerase family esterase [Microbispora rosea]GGO21988.1 hypothetical protein GCM10010116_44310 [Microbispora rosea subsp. aerata]GIH53824.1 hypothetical protein Mro02_07380 [Microbispora rosea subsp. aerata]GLJ85396.1 hypothetical protein GCM10017588_41280 [Microbispora rosea subsp. aerata]
MRRRIVALLAAVLMPVAAATTLLVTQPAAAASLTRVTNFGNNPSNLNMYIYVPDRVASRPALLVAVHYCTGTASALYSGYFRDYVTAADQYGYIIVFPEATRSGQCFDVYSPQALRRGGGSDPVGIMSMVDYTKSRYNVDPNRIFVSGVSSGAMMTNVLAAEYPDVFKAASAFMGVPAGCFATTDGSTWNSQCSSGQSIKTAQQWGDLARSMYPGYSGPYPRMQLWHGTQDTTLHYNNFGEEIKQWTNLHGVSQTPVSTDSPSPGWTRTRYGAAGTQPPVEAISASGQGHSLPLNGMISYAIDFLGLNGTTTPSPTPPTSPSPTPPVSPSPSPAVSPSPSPTPQPGGCSATIRTVNSWPGGFQSEVTVQAGSAALNGWTVSWSWPGGQSITQLWNGTVSGSGSNVTVRNAPYNGTVPAGSSTTFGFTANGTAATPALSCGAS